jgi:hypothetical protein
MASFRKLNQSLNKDFGFLIGENHVKLKDLTEEQARLVDSQFPGQYVEFILPKKQKHDKIRTESSEIGDVTK